jgi:hypothetical protein
LLAVLGRRREPAHLPVLGSYRPEDVLCEGHPLKTVLHELHIHGRCDTLPLTFLTEAAIAAYLIRRFPGLPLAEKLARFVHQRTDGNPLFTGNVVETWLAQGVLVEQGGQWTIPAAFEALSPGVPESLQQMIAQRLERLGAEDQRVVEAASVAGMEFSAAAEAAALSQKVAWVEVHCAHLARQGQLLRSSAERTWSDGTVATCYSFIHALYQEVVYNGCQRHSVFTCTGALAKVWRQGMVSKRATSRPSWRCTLSADETPDGRSAICDKRQTLPYAGMPMRKRPIISPKRSPCSKPSRPLPNARSKNSRSNVPLVPR